MTAMIKVGSRVAFGFLPKNTSESILWRVLAIEDDRVLIISDYGIKAMPYNEQFASVTWENCSVRRWLNSWFYNHAFTEDQKQKIITTHNVNKKNPKYSNNQGGNDTDDKVFLLSIEEADKYFVSSDDRIIGTVKYNNNHDAYIGDYGKCWWWLRGPGRNNDRAAHVGRDGYIGCIGNHVHIDDEIVRPAMWITNESKLI